MSEFHNISDLSAAQIKVQVLEFKENIKMYIEDNSIDDIIQFLKDDSRKSVKKMGDGLESFKEKYVKEVNRVKAMYDFDKSFGNYKYVAGVDEVGRGPLAGPIVTAAVVLDLDYEKDENFILGIKDSKKLSQKAREQLYKLIVEKAVDYSISVIDNNLIDEKGIAWCNNQSFINNIEGLNIEPNIVLSDGYRIKNFNINNEAVIKGDNKSASIACASIIAKVYRDRLMVKYAEKYPQYGFDNHVGYGTEMHIDAIKKNGICEIHRKSFLTRILER
jgi:ribonuclease HII